MSLQECLIIDPLTSEEVRTRVAIVMANRELLPITLINVEQEVPKPEEFTVFVDIKNSSHPDYGKEGIIKISGWRVDKHGNRWQPPTNVTIVAPTDPNISPTASLVTE